MGLFSQIDAVEILKRDKQIASLTAEIERLREALRGLLEAYSKPEMRLCCEGRECPCGGVTNHLEADRYARAALQPKEEDQ